MEAIDAFVARNPGRLRTDDRRESEFGCIFAARSFFLIS
jgi:hypothetical protein